MRKIPAMRKIAKNTPKSRILSFYIKIISPRFKVKPLFKAFINYRNSILSPYKLFIYPLAVIQKIYALLGFYALLTLTQLREAWNWVSAKAERLSPFATRTRSRAPRRLPDATNTKLSQTAYNYQARLSNSCDTLGQQAKHWQVSKLPILASTSRLWVQYGTGSSLFLPLGFPLRLYSVVFC
jgi:hypothetical protein